MMPPGLLRPSTDRIRQTPVLVLGVPSSVQQPGSGRYYIVVSHPERQPRNLAGNSLFPLTTRYHQRHSSPSSAIGTCCRVILRRSISGASHTDSIFPGPSVLPSPHRYQVLHGPGSSVIASPVDVPSESRRYYMRHRETPVSVRRSVGRPTQILSPIHLKRVRTPGQWDGVIGAGCHVVPESKTVYRGVHRRDLHRPAVVIVSFFSTRSIHASPISRMLVPLVDDASAFTSRASRCQASPGHRLWYSHFVVSG